MDVLYGQAIAKKKKEIVNILKNAKAYVCNEFLYEIVNSDRILAFNRYLESF